MTAVTGETGAGKTLVVEAIELLVGGRADPLLVRPGADEAGVEGRFVVDGEEVVLRRVVPRQGRSRAYVDGRLATWPSWPSWASRLVDLHGQHAHQSLLAPPPSARPSTASAASTSSRCGRARGAGRARRAELAALGGDERAGPARSTSLRFQVDEIDAAGLTTPTRTTALDAEEDLLADALAHQEAAAGGRTRP